MICFLQLLSIIAGIVNTHTPTHTPEMTDEKYDFESFHELIIETSCTNYLLEILHCQL